MARFRLVPALADEIWLDENGQWFHPDIEDIHPLLDGDLKYDVWKSELGVLPPPEFDGWILYALEVRSGVLLSWWACSHLTDGPDLSLRPRGKHQGARLR